MKLAHPVEISHLTYETGLYNISDLCIQVCGVCHLHILDVLHPCCLQYSQYATLRFVHQNHISVPYCTVWMSQIDNI